MGLVVTAVAASGNLALAKANYFPIFLATIPARRLIPETMRRSTSDVANA